MVQLPVGCGKDDPDSAQPAATHSTSAPTEKRDIGAFCSHMESLTTAAPTDPTALDQLYSNIESSAPEAIRTDVVEFIRLGRAVSDAFASAGAPTQEVDVEAVMAGLPPDVRAFVEELASSTQSGETRDTPTGRVFSYTVENCA